MQRLSEVISLHYARTRPDKRSQAVTEYIFDLIANCTRDLQEWECSIYNPYRMLRHRDLVEIHNTPWTVFLFGSKSDGTSSPSSDVDIAVNLNIGSSRKERKQLLYALSQIISTHDSKGTLLVKCILNCRYPIIKMVDIKSQDTMNVVIDDGFCHNRNRFTKDFIVHHTTIWCKKLKEPHCILKLLVFIKHWSRKRAINGSYSGYLSSFGFVVFFFKFIQWFQANKLDKRKKWSLAQILYEFYQFYLYNFDWNGHGVSLDLGYPFPYRKEIFNNKRNPYCALEVVDPINPKNNVSINVGTEQSQRIQYEFKRAVSILKRDRTALFETLCDTKIDNNFKINKPNMNRSFVDPLHQYNCDYNYSTKYILTPISKLVS